MYEIHDMSFDEDGTAEHAGFKSKYPFMKLMFAEGFYLEKGKKNDLQIARGICIYWSKKLDIEFWYRRCEDGRVKIWRAS